jgi:hypothetical protein
MERINSPLHGLFVMDGRGGAALVRPGCGAVTCKKQTSETSRNIHALFELFLAQNAHGIYVHDYFSAPVNPIGRS